MQYLNKNELLEIKGGISINGTIINSFVRGVNVFLELGRSLGTAIRMLTENKTCSL